MAQRLSSIGRALIKLGFKPISRDDPGFERIIRGMRNYPMTFIEIPTEVHFTFATDDTGTVWIKMGTAHGLEPYHFTDFFDEIDNRMKPTH